MLMLWRLISVGLSSVQHVSLIGPAVDGGVHGAAVKGGSGRNGELWQGGLLRSPADVTSIILVDPAAKRWRVFSCMCFGRFRSAVNLMHCFKLINSPFDGMPSC